MWIGVISLFPEMFRAITEHGVTGRAVKSGLLQIECWNPRDFTHDKHRTVDDRPYGGGPGMLMMVQPLRDALDDATLAGSVAAFEHHHHLVAGRDHPVLQLDQFALQADQFPEVMPAGFTPLLRQGFAVVDLQLELFVEAVDQVLVQALHEVFAGHGAGGSG